MSEKEQGAANPFPNVRPCTCHTDDAPWPCQRGHALSVCLRRALNDRNAEVERLRAALEQKKEPDWFWRDLDPDDSGCTVHEALRFVPEGVVCAIRSSYIGPTFFAAIVPVLDPESDDTEELRADTEADCILAVRERLKARAALTQEPRT